MYVDPSGHFAVLPLPIGPIPPYSVTPQVASAGIYINNPPSIQQNNVMETPIANLGILVKGIMIYEAYISDKIINTIFPGLSESEKQSNIIYSESPALNGSPYHPEKVENRVKPEYKTNPAHDKKSPLYNPKKGPEPSDAKDVYENAVRGGMGTWYGKNSEGEIYRYFSDNAGTVHFSGYMDPKKNEVPNDVLKELE